MRDFKLNASGDIEIVNGQIAMVEGMDQLLQNIRIALSTPKGSFLNYPNYGLDMDFIINGFDKEAGLVAVNDCILSIDRVTEVKDLHCEVDKDNNVANFIFAINSTIGSSSSNKEVPINAGN